ncbi:type VI secretion system tube protein TssD [Aquimarina sediminis]|uniref:type VI secretion system tube protein TssD n=1 Tax=Aquimarina sediminis TaxID=2070536 RepID=UPI000CA084D0|nr:type VI secretion system tube protein TssD [Aquimarina sediminis]
MSIIARLYADDKVYNVLVARYEITQGSDENGRPNSRPMFPGLLVVIESTKDTLFFEKAIHPTQQIDEVILEFVSARLGSRPRRIRFVNCYIPLDHNNFDATGATPYTETVLITAVGIENSHSRGKYSNPRRTVPFLSEQHPPMTTTQEQQEEPLKVINVSGPFDEAGNAIKYISPKHQYYYHATLKNYTEGSDLSQIQWSATYDDEDTLHQLTTGGTYQDGILKTPIQISKGKQTATLYAHIGNHNPNIKTKATYKQVVTFFIGGAGDKEPFYVSGATKIMEDVSDKFVVNYEQHNSVYMGYNEIKGEEDIKNNILSFIPNKGGTQINIVGHSLGGWNGAHLSRILTDTGYSVDTLVTLDPVGALTQVTLIADIHFKRPKPKVKYWVNIYTSPNNYRADDAIADLGGQWIPQWVTPHVMHISQHNHGEAEGMFKEVLSKKTISASSLLLAAIKNYIETK